MPSSVWEWAGDCILVTEYADDYTPNDELAEFSIYLFGVEARRSRLMYEWEWRLEQDIRQQYRFRG